MATETNTSFPDLLSAALDQSGITDEDFDFSIPQSTNLSTSDYGSLPGTVSEDSETTNGSVDPFENDNQGDIFTHALRQLAATSHIKPKEAAIANPVPLHSALPRQPMEVQAPLASVTQRQATPTTLPTTYQVNATPTTRPTTYQVNATPTTRPTTYQVNATPTTRPTTYQVTKVPGGPLSATGSQPKVITITRPGQQSIKISRVGQQPVLSKVDSMQQPVTLSGLGGQSVITLSKLGQQNLNLSGLKALNLPQALARHNSKIIVTTNNSSQFGNLSRLINTSTPIRVVSQASLTGGNVKIGNSNSLINSTLPSQPSIVQPISNAPLIANGNTFKAAPLTNKDVSRLWSTEDVKLKTFPSYSGMSSGGGRVKEEEDEVEEEEVQELGRAETYSEYMPSKLRLGSKHPDSVVETSSLSSVVPQDVHYRLALPEHVLDAGELSALQLEAIVYASQRQQTLLPNGERAGFLIGDGAGVGKGRTIAGIIYENYLLGRKRSIWLSVSNDLKVDAERDLRDIGAGKVEVHALNKFKYAKISSKENGSVKKGVIFATYSSLIGESQSGGKYRTRLKQLLHWCGEDFDGPIVFDECHKAKNLCPVGSSKPTKTGQTVLELQNRLPKAKVVYASATGASEPKNMAYMTRLGLWGPGTPFKEFTDFIQAVERRGVGAMELVAMDMKLRGMYIARQLSFHGVTFRVAEIPLNKDFIKMYDEAVKLWVQARENFQAAADLIDAEQRMKKSMWGQFWSAHQRFFKYLCISSKVHHCVKLAREAVKNGKCVVIGLQSTGEARTLDQLEDSGGELNDFVSTAKGVVQTLVEKHFPAPDRRKTFDFLMGSYSNPSSPIGKKRKKEQSNHSVAKKHRISNGVTNSENSDGNDSTSSESEVSDLSLSNSSDSSAEDSDNFNPFGGGSDSDDDPWLKKFKSKALKKSKPKKEKKVKKKKHKKMKQNKENKEDQQFDHALEAAGLMKNTAAVPPSTSTPNYSNNNSSSIEHAFLMKRDLLEKVERLGDLLPPNALDELIDELGGPENVAEMTGRKGRVVTNDDGSISYESRSEIDVPLEYLNLTEKQRFMDGEKNIAIISEAASSGISLQADRRVLNQRRRVHLTLELPWSADRAIQQFGRTHRSNQVSAPEYVFMISELAGERRFASTVAKRLESLGALTHGDRRATETRDLSRFNFDNKYGRTALESVMKSVLGFEAPFVAPPSNYEGKFFEDAKTALVGVGMVTVDERSKLPLLEKDYNNISKFLNRILGMTVEVQNALFTYFTDTLTAIILEAKRNGRWDMGIMDLGSGGESVRKLQTRTFTGDSKEGTAKTELHMMSVERGMNWTAMMNLWRQYTGPDDGLYMSTQIRNGKRTVVLAVMLGGNKKRDKLFSTYRPNTGLQPRFEPLAEIKKKYRKVLPDDAQRWWDEQYQSSLTVCSHAYWKGNCKKASLGLPCEIGLRTRTYHVLSGSVLSVWTKVESVLASMPGGAHSKMQIIRLKTEDGQRIVGSLIPSNCVAALSNVLSKETPPVDAPPQPGRSPIDQPGRSPIDQPGRSPVDESLSMPTLF